MSPHAFIHGSHSYFYLKLFSLQSIAIIHNECVGFLPYLQSPKTVTRESVSSSPFCEPYLCFFLLSDGCKSVISIKGNVINITETDAL